MTDPWTTLDHDRDTTLRLVEEGLLLKEIESHWCDVRSVRWDRNAVYVDACKFLKKTELGPVRASKLDSFSSIQYRVDPPVDLAYQHPLQLLVLGAPEKIVNPAVVLLTRNEKLEAALLKGLLPPTLAATQWEHLAAFLKSEKKAVLKPLHEAQSKGVKLLDASRLDEARAALSEASADFTRPVLLQRFLPGIAKGETRLWYLDGKLLACASKHPVAGDFRVNIDQGSQLGPHTLTAREKKAAALIGQRLKKLKVRLAAIDLIDGYATDFNLTSPGLITQMERVTGRNLAREIVLKLARPV